MKKFALTLALVGAVSASFAAAPKGYYPGQQFITKCGVSKPACPKVCKPAKPVCPKVVKLVYAPKPVCPAKPVCK